MKSVGGVAPPTAQGAAGQAHKNGGPALAFGFALDGEKNLTDFQAETVHFGFGLNAR